MTLSSRKGPGATLTQADHAQLQWGRDVVITEGTLREHLGLLATYTLQWGRDVVITEGSVELEGRIADPFKLQWGRDVVITEGPRPGAGLADADDASMGP